LFEAADGNTQGQEHSLAYVKYYQEREEDKWTNSKQLVWAKKRRHGGGEGFWYDVVDVADILGPVFVVPDLTNKAGSPIDAFYICPWQR
jgi:hypothetical protein